MGDAARAPFSVLVYALTYPLKRKKAETGTVLCWEKKRSTVCDGLAKDMKWPKTIMTHKTNRSESNAVMRSFLVGVAGGGVALAAATAPPRKVDMILFLSFLMLRGESKIGTLLLARKVTTEVVVAAKADALRGSVAKNRLTRSKENLVVPVEEEEERRGILHIMVRVK